MHRGLFLCGVKRGLADGAAKFVGNITTRSQVRSDFTQLWNQITAENECKWASIEGSRGKFNWGGLFVFVDIIKIIDIIDRMKTPKMARIF